jgi:putative endonuclease
MTYYVYILQSCKSGIFYKGQTQNLTKRILEHNSGKSNYTSKGIPWNLVWYKKFETRKEAFAFEQKLKKLKSRKRLIRLIEESQVVDGSENLQISNLLDFREST